MTLFLFRSGGHLHLRPVRNALPPPPRAYRCQSSLDRIHDGIEVGVAFTQGGKGRVEDCKIFGNAEVGVGIVGSGSEAVVAVCKCAREGTRCFTL